MYFELFTRACVCVCVGVKQVANVNIYFGESDNASINAHTVVVKMLAIIVNYEIKSLSIHTYIHIYLILIFYTYKI